MLLLKINFYDGWDNKCNVWGKINLQVVKDIKYIVDILISMN